jgi:hypothetical protein
VYSLYLNHHLKRAIKSGLPTKPSDRNTETWMVYCCTSLFHRLGAGGSPPRGGPRDPGLELGPSDGAGAGLMGKLITFGLPMFVLLEVRAGYEGRGGAGPDMEPLDLCDLTSAAEPLLSIDGFSLSCSLMLAAEGAGARYDLRLLCSIMLTAHASRSTGVRLAACKKASWS